MIENIEQMRERHEHEISHLQKTCSHKKTKRLPYMWAPGHFSADVEVCQWCGRILKTYEDSKLTAVNRFNVETEIVEQNK